MKKVLFALLIIVSLLVVIETCLRLSFTIFVWQPEGISPDESVVQNKLWQQQLFKNFIGVHQPDPYLLWKFKPNLNKPIFVTNSKGLLGPEFKPKKKEGTLRILLLGDSSPVGLGLPDRKYAFGEQFLQLLRENYPNHKFELINAAVSGYTSIQGLLWFKQHGIKLKPDLVLIYFGNNDASYNGYLEDKELLRRPAWMIELQTFLGRFAVYNSMRKILLPLKEKFLVPASKKPKKLTVRVTPEDYFKNLAEIVKLAEAKGSRVLLMTVPVPRHWPPAIEFKPFVNLQTLPGELVMADESRNLLSAQVAYCLDWSEIKLKYPQIDYWTLNVLLQAHSDTADIDSALSKYQSELMAEPDNLLCLNNLSVLHWRKKNYFKSHQYLTRALAQDTASAVLHFNFAMTARALGDTASAEQEFEKAKELDYYSLRTKNIYNQKIKDLAEGYKLLLANLDSLFLANHNEFLFIDHCHPQPEGHRLIAEALLEKIKETGWLDNLPAEEN